MLDCNHAWLLILAAFLNITSVPYKEWVGGSVEVKADSAIYSYIVSVWVVVPECGY